MATLFFSTPTALTDFTDGSPTLNSVQAGESVVFNATAGPAGGAAIVVTATTASSATAEEVGVRASVMGGSGRSMKWAFMLPSSGTLNNSSVTNFIWSNTGSGNYSASIGQVGITQGRTQNGTVGSSGAYRMFLQTPLDMYATLYYGGMQMARNIWYTIELRISDDQMILYVTDPTSGVQEAQCYVRGTSGAYFHGSQFGAVTFGKINNGTNTNYGYSGTLNFAQVGLYSLTAPVAAVSPSNIFVDLWNGKKSRDMRHDGAIVRHMGYAPGSQGDGGYGYSGTAGSDIVSEGQAYGAFSAVQAGDQAGANLIFNFAYQTLCRRNTAVASAQNNSQISGQTTTYAPNLMGYKYQDDIGGFWDANPATDAENDMMKAYFLAHGRFGSSAYTPGSAQELVSLNYLQRGINVAHDLKTYTFTQGTDALGAVMQIQSADAINGINEMNPSYYDPWAFRLAAQYDTVNTTFWNQAVSSSYAILNSDASLDSYGGPTEWVAWSGTSNGHAQADGGRSTQGGLEYHYNAFRTPHRVNWDYYFYAEPKALAYMTGTFRTASTAEWNTVGMFAMEKTNTGTPSTTPAYEKTANTYGQWKTQSMGTPTSVSSAIHSSKLNWSSLYQPSENGSIIQDGPAGTDSYFMDYWGMFAYATDNGVMTNYNGSAVTKRVGYTLDSLINTVSVSTKRDGFTLDGNIIVKKINKGITLDSYLTAAASPTKQRGFTLDTLIKVTSFASLTLDSFINAAPPGTQVSRISIPATALTYAGLIQHCQALSGNKDTDSVNLFKLYLNLAQKEVENSFADHPGLQASAIMSLVPSQDYSYGFAPDFRKERYLRLVAPVQFSHPLEYVEYTQFRNAVNDLALQTFSLPRAWYWAPESPPQFHVYPVPDKAYVLQYDYVRYAPDLIADTDTSFIDREYVHMLCYQALFYYYNSGSIGKAADGAQWNILFTNKLADLKKDYQRRQLQTTSIPYATGVNEGSVTGGYYIGR